MFSMLARRIFPSLLLCFISLSAARAQQVPGSGNNSVVPRLVTFTGVLPGDDGRPLAGTVGATFALYQEQQGGSPLWIETQNVHPDKTGRYAVMLGSTTSAGIPADLFAAGEARWLGVQVAGQAEQARVLLVAVPYAMKAADAETIGGLPPSAFVLAAPAGSAASANGAATTADSPFPPPASSNVTTTGGTVNTIPLFTTATNIQNSAITQTGSGATAKIGIGIAAPAATLDIKGGEYVRGTFTLPSTATATAAKGANSQPELMIASAFNSGTAAAVNQKFQLQAEPAGNDTATPSGTLNLLFGSGTASPTETGLKISNTGIFTFAAGQTFPGTGSITGVTTASGSGLIGGGASGTLNLGLTTSCSAGQTLAWNGAAWACKTGGSGTVTSVGLVAPGSDFTVTYSPVTGSGNLVLSWIVDPTSANVGSAIVKRDPSGSFNANNISAGGAISVGSTLTTTGNATFFSPVGIGTGTPQALLNLDFNSTANSDTLLVGNNSTKGVQLRDTGVALDLESIGAPLYINWVTGQPTFVGGNAVGIGTTAPQALLNLNYAGNANADTLLVGNNTSKGVQLRDTGTAVDLESIGVPLYVNNVTQQPLYLNPSGGAVYVDTAFTGAVTYALQVGEVANNGTFLSAVFSNDVAILGDFTVNGTKNFRIDHPLDPTNKYLYHAAIESSEVLNQYSGNAILDDKGEARVEFPAWFGAINEDFRYQLTAVGVPGPNLFIAEEIKDSSFTIAGGKPGMKVSWQVTARRNDAYMRAHPYVVERDKPEGERGYYARPELYGAPKEMSILSAHPLATKER